MHGRARANDGYKWILVAIDTFSKYAWAVPVKNKSAHDMLEAFKKLLSKSSPRKPVKLQTDKGLEFTNSELNKFLDQQGIHRFSSESDQKAAGAERFNRTIKTKIETAINTHQDERWVDRLDQYLESYNHAKHRTIGMRPVDVKPEHEEALFLKMYRKDLLHGVAPRDKAAVKSGDMVRISNVKGDFAKGYYPNWSEQHFLVKDSKVMPGGAKRQYFLKETDWGEKKGEDIKGAFNREEIQPITNNRYRIKVLRTRSVGKGRKEYFVEWIGWPASYNSWITEEQLTLVSQPHGESV